MCRIDDRSLFKAALEIHCLPITLLRCFYVVLISSIYSLIKLNHFYSSDQANKPFCLSRGLASPSLPLETNSFNWGKSDCNVIAEKMFYSWAPIKLLNHWREVCSLLRHDLIDLRCFWGGLLGDGCFVLNTDGNWIAWTIVGWTKHEFWTLSIAQVGGGSKRRGSGWESTCCSVFSSRQLPAKLLLGCSAPIECSRFRRTKCIRTFLTRR